MYMYSDDCSKCKNKNCLRICTRCDVPFCSLCDPFIKSNGHVYCDKCKDSLCKTCEGEMYHCFKCKREHCTVCDDGFFHSTWGDFDRFYCHNCREITIEELYQYFVDKYKDPLPLKEIRKLILKS